MFNGILTPRQLEGLRLLLTPFPEQQFNATEDRRAELPSQGAACFDCHSNGHQNGATHQAPDARPQWFHHRIKTISLRGLNVQRLFGSQRALKTVEDFTQFEQRTAYFDGDIVEATKKGVNPLERGSQVDFMADFQEMLDFPPAPKLDVLGKLDPAKASQAEMRGQEVFFGKGRCASCHQPPFYTDNLMHDLHGDGPIKTFALRGAKDNPPYMHDERLLTLEDTVEFFNLILGTKLTPQEKQDLVAFLRAL
jgi:cytochrome c peroxidase